MAASGWQLDNEGPRRYEEILVPAILGPAAAAVVDSARIGPADRVLDVGCGTGAAARCVSAMPLRTGVTIGIDVNPAMVLVARSRANGRGAAYHTGNAQALPYRDGAFDVVVCAQSLQFVPDPVTAVREMKRVLAPGGRVIIGVWRPIEQNPYFDVLASAMEHHVGAGSARGLQAAFSLSDGALLGETLRDGGFTDTTIGSAEIRIMLPPLDAFVERHIGSTPMQAGYAAAPAAIRNAVVRTVIERLDEHDSHTGTSVPFRTYLAAARA